MMRKQALLALTLATLAGAPRSAPAQTISELLPQLVAKGATIDSSASQQQHFLTATTLTTVPGTLNAALALQVSDFPLGPVSGGLIYSRDTSGPEMHFAFGTSYTDRGLPLGRGRLTGSITFLNNNYSSFEDVDIKGDGINFLFAHVGPQPNVTDVLQETVSIRLNRKVTSFLFTYGATSRLDIGLAIPVEELAMDVRVASRIVRVPQAIDTLRLNQQPHGFDPILTAATNTTWLNVDYTAKIVDNNYGLQGLSTIGIGDLLLRGKYAVVAGSTQALAVSLDLSAPTGNADQLLGTGAWRAKPGVAWSAALGRSSVHANAGYTYSRGSLSSKLQAGASSPLDLRVPNEINWAAGLEASLAPRVTLVADAFGRRLSSVPRFSTGRTIFFTGAPGGPAQDVAAGTDLISAGRSAVNQVFGIIGGRFNLGGTVFANGSVMFPISVRGLKPDTTSVFSIDYVF